MIRGRESALALGGWANPHANPAAQVQHLLDDRVTAEFYLTQIVSHHSRPAVERFLAEGERRGLTLPGMFGVFYYRSANTRTLETLREFLPVPVDELREEFAGRRDAGLGLRTIHPRAHGVRRAPLLRQQPSGRQSRVDAGASPGNGVNPWVNFSTAFPSPASSASAT